MRKLLTILLIVLIIAVGGAVFFLQQKQTKPKLSSCIKEVNESLFPKTIGKYGNPLLLKDRRRDANRQSEWKSPTGPVVQVSSVIEKEYEATDRTSGHFVISIAKYTNQQDFERVNHVVLEPIQVLKDSGFEKWQDYFSLSQKTIDGTNVVITNQKDDAMGYIFATIPEQLIEIDFEFSPQNSQLEQSEKIFREWISKVCK